MADTAIAPSDISPDADLGLRLTDEAIERAKQKLRVRTIDDVRTRLGFSRQTFWRLRKGTYDIRLSRAAAIADLVEWPINRTFEQVPRD